MNETPDDNQVAVKDACAGCGERDMDLLVWCDNDRIRCMTCGTEYAPGHSEKAE